MAGTPFQPLAENRPPLKRRGASYGRWLASHWHCQDEQAGHYIEPPFERINNHFNPPF